MKFNHLVLGAAAGVLAATGAQAADLADAPAPESIDYVRVCDAYGSAFFVMPGTETCMKIDGFVRFNMGLTFDGDGTSYNDQTTSPLDGYVRGRANFDVRENSAWGTLRGYLRVEVERDIDSNSDGSSGGASDDISSGNTFIQIGDGFLVGYNTSNYDFWTGYVTGGTVVGSDHTLLQASYTASLGNGVFASLALEDSQSRGQTLSDGIDGAGEDESGSGKPNGEAIDSGNRFPDIVANIAYDHGIISAQVMGALHFVDVANKNGDKVETADDIGWAVGAGMIVDLPFRNGVDWALQGGYSQGAANYTDVGANWNSDGHHTINANGSVEIETTTGWSVGTGWSTTVVDGIGLNGQLGVSNFRVGNLSLDDFRTGASVSWTPLDNFIVSAGINYQAYRAKETGESNIHREVTTGVLRLQRNF